jgi:hypothetical protein
VSSYALRLFAGAETPPAARSLRYEYDFRADKDGIIILADEIHTPDSSRY